MKRIKSIDSSLSLQRCADSIFADRSLLSSSIISHLLKKAGDLRIHSMLNPIFMRYYHLIGYSEIVTNELIDQHCRYYNIDAIADLYASLKSENVLFSKSTYEKFLLSLLRSIQYEQVCLNITKEMLKQGYLLSSESLFKALSFPAVCNSEIFISVLSITDAKAISLNQLASLLGQRLIAFSKAHREVSVNAIYKYLSIASPASDKRGYLPYLTQSYRYFFERFGWKVALIVETCRLSTITKTLL